MRPIALPGLTLALLLGGCGNTWWNPPLTGGYSPNVPVNDSDNMRRVMGQDSPTAALETEPGDIWPGPLPPSPTLNDIELQTRLGGDSAPETGKPPAPQPAPNPARGSSTPPASTTAAAPVPLSRPASTTTATPTARDPAGQVIPTGRGQAVTTGGTPGYQTTVTPGGGSAIVVPNGNGTSTVIHADGRVETVPVPK